MSFCSIPTAIAQKISFTLPVVPRVFLGVSQSKLTLSQAVDPTAPLRALWQGRNLLWQFTQRNVALRHKGSHLGLIWSLLNPLLMLGLNVFIFGYIFKSRFGNTPDESRLDFALGLFLGLTLFQLFSETLALAPTLIVSNPNLVKKVVFPLEILPAASVGSSLFHTSISLALVLVGVATLGPGLNWQIFWLPVVFLPLVPLALGIAWFFAALGVFLRDINQLVGVMSVAWMYSSAIVYSPALIPPGVWTVLRFNPLLLAVDLARDVVMWHEPVNFHHLAYLFALGGVVCVGGYSFFRKMSPAFADVL